MIPLPLSGRIKLEGFLGGARRELIRLADPHIGPSSKSDAALVRTTEDHDAAISAGFWSAFFIGHDPGKLSYFGKCAHLGAGFDWLCPGDVIAVEPRNSRYRVLWRRNSLHNAFLVTEQCDHYCLMCSQPPKAADDSWVIEEIEACLPLLDPDTAVVGFTGGEPFLKWKRFIPLVKTTLADLPKSSIHVLSNGRAFSKSEVVTEWSTVDQARTCLGIPIYSAVDSIHDYIVQSRGAFDETVLGILRLKDKGNHVEVRVVLHQLSVERLVQTSEWLARNLPFLDHVALMGMENTGFALANHEALWIDPMDYGDSLARAVDILSQAKLRVSIYNLPLCVLPAVVRPFAVQSISDWKNAYPKLCSPCGEKTRCAGFFTTGRTKFSRGISPIC